MRARMVVACLAAILLGCVGIAGMAARAGVHRDGLAVTPGTSPGRASAFLRDARQAVADWERRGLDQRWLAGRVLLADGLTVAPESFAYPSKAASESITSGWFELASPLRGASFPAVIRWADGHSERTVVPDASTVYRQLSRRLPCGAATGCPVYRVTGATPGAPATILTSRGPATVPTWDFSLKQPPFHVRQVALDMRRYSVLGQVDLSAPATSVHGRTLTVTAIGDPCATSWGAEAYETDRALVLATWTSGHSQAHDDGYCGPQHRTLELLGKVRVMTIHLSRPFSGQILLDLQGRPSKP